VKADAELESGKKAASKTPELLEALPFARNQQATARSPRMASATERAD
jgi:hypothetical protein